jgi:hypothetical protein
MSNGSYSGVIARGVVIVDSAWPDPDSARSRRGITRATRSCLITPTIVDCSQPVFWLIQIFRSCRGGRQPADRADVKEACVEMADTVVASSHFGENNTPIVC